MKDIFNLKRCVKSVSLYFVICFLNASNGSSSGKDLTLEESSLSHSGGSETSTRSYSPPSYHKSLSFEPLQDRISEEVSPKNIILRSEEKPSPEVNDIKKSLLLDLARLSTLENEKNSDLKDSIEELDLSIDKIVSRPHSPIVPIRYSDSSPEMYSPRSILKKKFGEKNNFSRDTPDQDSSKVPNLTKSNPDISRQHRSISFDSLSIRTLGSSMPDMYENSEKIEYFSKFSVLKNPSPSTNYGQASFSPSLRNSSGSMYDDNRPYMSPSMPNTPKNDRILESPHSPRDSRSLPTLRYQIQPLNLNNGSISEINTSKLPFFSSESCESYPNLSSHSQIAQQNIWENYLNLSFDDGGRNTINSFLLIENYYRIYEILLPHRARMMAACGNSAIYLMVYFMTDPETSNPYSSDKRINFFQNIQNLLYHKGSTSNFKKEREKREEGFKEIFGEKTSLNDLKMPKDEKSITDQLYLHIPYYQKDNNRVSYFMTDKINAKQDQDFPLWQVAMVCSTVLSEKSPEFVKINIDSQNIVEFSNLNSHLVDPIIILDKLLSNFLDIPKSNQIIISIISRSEVINDPLSLNIIYDPIRETTNSVSIKTPMPDRSFFELISLSGLSKSVKNYSFDLFKSWQKVFQLSNDYITTFSNLKTLLNKQ